MESNGTRVGVGLPAAEHPRTPRTWHVWVNLSRAGGNHPVVHYPGLVLSWRRTRTTWEALVVYVTPTDTGETSHITWIEAEQLSPVRPETHRNGH